MATNPIKMAKAPPAWVREVVAGIALTFIGAMALMFGMGNAHEIWSGVPALGYWDSFFLLLWADVVVNAVLFGVRVKLIEEK